VDPSLNCTHATHAQHVTLLSRNANEKKVAEGSGDGGDFRDTYIIDEKRIPFLPRVLIFSFPGYPIGAGNENRDLPFPSGFIYPPSLQIYSSSSRD
jgi:hypothetical protein